VTEESIFAAALAIPSPSARAAYLDRACAGRPALRKEVEELLAAHAADNPLDRPPAALGRTGAYEPAPDDPPPASTGDRIGPYRLMEQIGEGGFGLVFVAEQAEPVRRKVALKVLKPGMDTRDVVARLEAERQALALMDHPNIAKVLDAGSTPAGRPYFVMELVTVTGNGDSVCKAWIRDNLRKKGPERGGGCGPALCPTPFGASSPANCHLSPFPEPLSLTSPTRRLTVTWAPFPDFPDKEINELGARGIGEIGLAGIAAAITAAVHHATGVRVRELPVKIEHLLA
jgi:hypothetical protein